VHLTLAGALWVSTLEYLELSLLIFGRSRRPSRSVLLEDMKARTGFTGDRDVSSSGNSAQRVQQILL
jgi:hypothetical protein